MYKKEYYKILKLNRNATEEEIKKAYRRQAFFYHPDRNNGNREAEERFKEIGEAYAVLSDRKRREGYDVSGYAEFRHRHTVEDIFDGFNFEDIIRNFNLGFKRDISGSFFCGGRGGGCGRKKARFFGKGFVKDRPFNSQTIDRTYDLPLTSSEGFYGTEKEILLKKGSGTERIIIRIPPGVEEGALLKLSLKAEDSYGGLRDNLYLKVKIVED